MSPPPGDPVQPPNPELLAAFADGELGATASPAGAAASLGASLDAAASPEGAVEPGDWTVRVFAPSEGRVAKLPASLSRPSVETGGGSDIASAMSATPRARILSITATMPQAASQVWGTALLGQKPPATPEEPGTRQAPRALARHDEGARSSRSGIAGYQSLRGPPNDGR